MSSNNTQNSIFNNTDWKYAQENYELIGKEIKRIIINYTYQYFEVANYRLPDDSIKQYIIKQIPKPNLKLTPMSKDLNRREERIKIALEQIKLTPEASEKARFLSQLNYAVENYKKDAQNKKNMMSDLDVALKLKGFENEAFPEFSKQYEHSLSKWMDDTINQNENSGVGEISTNETSSLEQEN